MSRPYTAPAIRRAAEMLRYLAESPTPVRLTELAQELDCGKSSVLGLLRTLEEVSWVERDSDGAGFRLGEGLWDLARKAFGWRDVAQVARPLLERVAERGGESTFLGILREGQVVIEDCVEGGHEMCVGARPGGTLPLFAGATGKVLLAGMDESEARATVLQGRLPGFTERSMTDPEVFLAEVARTRERGYGTDDEEYLRGVRAVAAPIRVHGRVAAVMWVAGFSSRVTDPRLAEVLEELLQAVSICGALLESGGRGHPTR